MKKEKHILTNPYNHHALSRYIDVYEVSASRCYSVPESGYKGTEATLVDDPAWNEKFSSYSITGATLTGNNFILDNDVTAQANYETAKNVTLQTDGHGTIASTKNSGFINDNATLSNTASNGYGFSGYSITGAILTGSNFKFTGSDITAKAWFSALPTSALYWSDAGSNVATIGTNIVKNVNKAVTAFNYFTVKFSLKAIDDDYFYFGAGHFYINFDKGHWYILNHFGYPTNEKAGIRREENLGQTFYPTNAAAGKKYPSNSEIYTYYSTAYNITSQVNYKYVIDRNNARCSAFLNNVYMGYGNTSANITAINSLTGSWGGNASNTGKMTASNYSVAGFASLSNATAY